MPPVRILCVDDDLPFLGSLKEVLLHNGFEVSAVASVPEALELISSKEFDILLSDLNIGQPGDGFTVVSAMRRVQPRAWTFIITGYPDIDSAITAIQNQVDDYLAKPLDMKGLLTKLSSCQGSSRPMARRERPRHISELIRGMKSSIVQKFLTRSQLDPELAQISVSIEERVDHLPELLEDLSQRLDNRDSLTLNARLTEAARKHGRSRHSQGYTIPQIVCETRILQEVLSELIQGELVNLEVSTLVNDTFEIGQALQAVLEVSLRSYQSQIPHSLQASFSSLYNSPYLGVALANENQIIDANNTLLGMLGCTREQLVSGQIDWMAMTPERFRPLDVNALEQLREFGACVPFEKEFLLPNGARMPFLIGAIRLSRDPLQWSAFIVDLTKQRKVQEAEQRVRDSEARHKVVNQLAHEINNPLAALMFTIHLLGTQADLPADARELVRNADHMLKRMAETANMVLIETRR